jgi:plasmid stabilization system protein ParE
MKHKLIITQRAAQERDRAFTWYSDNYSSEFAARWYDGISQVIESLPRNLARGHKAAENDRFPFELYEVLYGKRMNKHRILYRVEGNTVAILHIRHSAQHELTESDL